MKALTMRMVIGAAAVAIVAARGNAAPDFAKKPVVSKDGAGCKIEFAAAAPTDCAVYLLDAQGKVARHLAAGVLGDKAPAPLKPGLVQSLVWDGKDDLGKPAAGGPFKVRVGLGLDLKPEKVYGGPGTVGATALAVGQNGELYALGMVSHLHNGDATAVCRVFDRQGKYLRTIMPRPGELPDEKTAGFGQLEIAGQGKIPFVHNGESRSLYPDLRQPSRCSAVVTSAGRFVFADSNNPDSGTDSGAGPMYLMSVEKDGSCPAAGFLGATLPGGTAGCPALALTPDEKTIYATGFGNGNPYKIVTPIHAVYKLPVGAAKGAKPEVFVGVPAVAGADDKHFNDPRGVAVDGEGNVYVSDFGNGRIVAFKPDGTVLGQVKLDKPGFLAVHPKTGVIYALTGNMANKLVRISGLKEGKISDGPTYRVGAGMEKNIHSRPVLALDWRAEPAVLWVGTADSYYSKWELKRFEDINGVLSGERDGFAAKPREEVYLFDMTLDHQKDVLYVRNGGAFISGLTVIDGKTGARRTVSLPSVGYPEGSVVLFGRDGYMYYWTSGHKKAGIYRFTADFKPAPFAGGDSNFMSIDSDQHSIHLLARGGDVNSRGEGIVILQDPKASRSFDYVMAFGPDGKVRKERLVDGLFAGDCSARLDEAGNIYVATCARPEGEVVPPEFQGQVPAKKMLSDGYINWYPALCGSIVKFGPEGGAFRTGDRKIVLGYGAGRNQAKEMFVQGALWMKSGISQVPLHGGAGGAHYCSCEQIRFDVDGFGRIFAPDTLRFQAVVLDNAGNAIGRFGTYGNIDSQFAGGAAMRFAWPEFVMAGDEAAYVGDIVNSSILRATIGYAAEEVREVK